METPQATIQSQEAAQSVMETFRPYLEGVFKRTFERFAVVWAPWAGFIRAIVGVSYHFQVQISETECIQVRLFENPKDDGEFHILALKLAKMKDKFHFLDPRDGYVQI
jgi:hypothetical protein